MTPSDLSAALRRIGWSASTLARHAGVSERTARRWVEGRYPVPEGVAEGLVRLVAWLEVGQFGRREGWRGD